MSDFVSRAPEGYVCPICVGLNGGEGDTLIRPTDIIYQDELTTALVNSFFQHRNEGHVIVVPNEHYENIYDLPSEQGHRIFDVAQMVARAIKIAYKCDGITTRQNNEPGGDQHAFHYHMHVYPRYGEDRYNEATKDDRYLADPEERAIYAEKVKAELSKAR